MTQIRGIQITLRGHLSLQGFKTCQSDLKSGSQTALWVFPALEFKFRILEYIEYYNLKHPPNENKEGCFLWGACAPKL